MNKAELGLIQHLLSNISLDPRIMKANIHTPLTSNVGTPQGDGLRPVSRGQIINIEDETLPSFCSSCIQMPVLSTCLPVIINILGCTVAADNAHIIGHRSTLLHHWTPFSTFTSLDTFLRFSQSSVVRNIASAYLRTVTLLMLLSIKFICGCHLGLRYLGFRLLIWFSSI